MPDILGPIGILALADLNTVPLRTALTGTSHFLDTLILAPGLHKQSTAPDLNKGEYPACAAMTTGYVFRVENPATVLYMQRVGKTGHLTMLAVENKSRPSPLAQLACLAAVALTVFLTTIVAILIEYIYTICVIALLFHARLLNTVALRQRARPGWFGAAEPGAQSDLLVLLSQDRWFRIQGATDDVKAVTSGTWLRDATFLESSSVSCAMLIVYLSAAISIKATLAGELALLVLFVGNSTLLGLANELTKTLTMFGRTISVRDGPKKYSRRLELTKELVREFKRTDCFVAMGMIQPEKEAEYQESYKGTVIM